MIEEQDKEENLDDLKCKVLPATLIDEAAGVLADAFSNSPAYIYVFREDQDYRRNALMRIFQENLTLMQQRYPSSFRGVLNNNGEVVACFLWIPSPYHIYSLWDVVKAGVWKLPFLFGLSTFANFSKMASTFRDDEKLFHMKDGEEFIKLERLAVRSDYRRKGLAKKCLQTVILEEEKKEKLSAFAPPRVIRLTTQEEWEVKFYEKIGFSISGVNDHFQDDEQYKYRCWFMTRRTATASK